MLNPERPPDFPKMTAEKRSDYARALVEEAASKQENIAAARDIAGRLKLERKTIAQVVTVLRESRESAGVSLNELEARCGISKSSLSRLENSAAPNPTLLTLYRYAAAINVDLQIVLAPKTPKPCD